MFGQGVVSLVIPGYSDAPNSIPETNNAGGAAIQDMQATGLPPVVWMLVFLVTSYVGLRLLLEGE